MGRLGSLAGRTLDQPTLAEPTLRGSSLAGDTLDAQTFTLEPLGASSGANPVVAYGTQAAAWIMRSIDRVPSAQRKVALRALLDAVDPTLWSAVAQQGQVYANQGLPAKQALERALAEAMSKGIASEIIETGKRALRGDRAPVKAEGLMGLGFSPQARAVAQYDALEALGFSLSSLNPVKAVTGAARAIAGAAGTIARGARNAAGEVWDGTKWVGGKIGAGAETAAGWVKDGVKALGGLACSLASSGAGQLAAGAGALAAGAPPQVGQAGAAAVVGMCSKGAGNGAGAAAPFTPPAVSATPAWLLPAAIGAAGLILVLALK